MEKVRFKTALFCDDLAWKDSYASQNKETSSQSTYKFIWLTKL
jgi:hypothetical protein